MHCSCFSFIILNFNSETLSFCLPPIWSQSQFTTTVYRYSQNMYHRCENWMSEPRAQTASICVMAVLWTVSHPVFIVWSISLRICADCTEQHFLVNCVCWLCQTQHLFHVTTNIDFFSLCYKALKI